MKRLLKFGYFLVLYVVTSSNVFCEVIDATESELTLKKNSVPFKTKIVCTNSYCKDAVVKIYNQLNFNFDLDTNTALKTLSVGTDGILSLEVPRDVFYIIEITKQGYIHKRFSIDTKNLPDNVWNVAYAGFNIESVSLFEKIQGVNYNMFNYPLVIIEYNFDKETFDYNAQYSDLALSSIEIIENLELKQLAFRKSRVEYFELERINKIIMFSYSIALIGLIGIIIFLIKKISKIKNV